MQLNPTFPGTMFSLRSFNDYFGIDFESFVVLSKQEQIENFQKSFF